MFQIFAFLSIKSHTFVKTRDSTIWTGFLSNEGQKTRKYESKPPNFDQSSSIYFHGEVVGQLTLEAK